MNQPIRMVTLWTCVWEVDKFVPKKMRRKGNKPLWMNKNILRMIRKKRRLWRSYSTEERSRRDFASFQAFKNIQNEVQKAVKKAKRKLERSLAKNSKKNPKAFYSYMKKKTSNKVTVGPLKTSDGKLVIEDKEMADILNRHYCNMFTREDHSNMPGVANGQMKARTLIFSTVTLLKHLTRCHGRGFFPRWKGLEWVETSWHG